MMNKDYIEDLISHSHHAESLAHAHNVGIGVHHDPDHMETNGMAIPASVLSELKMEHGNLSMLSSWQIDDAVMEFLAKGNLHPDIEVEEITGSIHAGWGKNANDEKWKVQAVGAVATLDDAQKDDEDKKARQQAVAQNFYQKNIVERSVDWIM